MGNQCDDDFKKKLLLNYFYEIEPSFGSNFIPLELCCHAGAQPAHAAFHMWNEANICKLLRQLKPLCSSQVTECISPAAKRSALKRHLLARLTKTHVIFQLTPLTNTTPFNFSVIKVKELKRQMGYCCSLDLPQGCATYFLDFFFFFEHGRRYSFVLISW